MAGILVDLNRDILASTLGEASQLLRLRDGRVLVLLAKDREERAMEAIRRVGGPQ